jgi:uncharacterized protein (UPF0333 family)
MNKLNNQNGFAASAVLMLLVAILAVGGGAYYVSKHKNKSSDSSTATVAPSPAASTKAQASSAEKDLVADAIVKYCVGLVPSVDQQQLKKLYLSTYNSSNSNLTVKGNYAKSGGNCGVTGTADNPQPDPDGEFEAWLTKTGDSWKVAFAGQQSPSCSEADGQGWPKDLLAECLDDQTGSSRAPKS